MVMASILSLQWGAIYTSCTRVIGLQGGPQLSHKDLGRFSLKREEEVVLPVCRGRVRQPARIWD